MFAEAVACTIPGGTSYRPQFSDGNYDTYMHFTDMTKRARLLAKACACDIGGRAVGRLMLPVPWRRSLT